MSRPDSTPPDFPAPGTAPSKSKRKRDMHALQDLGERLVALDASRLASLELPERLVDAVTLARRITRHEGRRRQMQFIGRLMREVDPAPLEAAFARWEQGPAHERERFASLERWRARLLDEAGGLDEFAAAYPGADRALLAELIARSRAERDRGGPPHRQRELFRAIRTATEPAAS